MLHPSSLTKPPQRRNANKLSTNSKDKATNVHHTLLLYIREVSDRLYLPHLTETPHKNHLRSHDKNRSHNPNPLGPSLPFDKSALTVPLRMGESINLDDLRPVHTRPQEHVRHLC